MAAVNAAKKEKYKARYKTRPTVAITAIELSHDIAP